MARMSLEQRLADKFADTAVRMDFDPEHFGYMLSKCGVHIQVAMYRALVSLIEHWAIDFDYRNDRGMPEYGKITQHATVLIREINSRDMRM